MGTVSEPERIERLGETALKIRWTDGHESIYTWVYLRRYCPCAACSPAVKGSLPMAIDPAIRPMELKPVGRYAVSVRFSDGHTTGIFSHEYLRSICPCEECKPTQFTEG